MAGQRRPPHAGLLQLHGPPWPSATALPAAMYSLSLLIGLVPSLLPSKALADRIPAGMGPFRAEFRGQSLCPTSEQCSHPEKMDIKNVQVIQDPNNPYKYTYNMDVNMSIPVDNNYKTEIRVSKWNSLTKGWTNNVLRMTVPNVCTAFKTHRPDIFKQVLDALYDGTVTDCPFPPVKTQLHDLTIETKPPSNIKTLPYGRFRARMKLLEPNQMCVMCNDAVIDILPKNH